VVHGAERSDLWSSAEYAGNLDPVPNRIEIAASLRSLQ
jgi:hypothetical protein